MELSTVPRTSTVTCADGNIGSATTININRASSGFTHTLKYSFGGLNGTIATKTGNISIGWTIPTSFYTKVPNAKSGQGTITCETYSGDALIGTTTCSFNAFVINSDPTIAATVIDVNETTKALTGDANKLIKYFSNAKVTITATAKNSSTIQSQKVVCGAKSATTAISTLNNIETGTFDISCTDSRGLTANAKITKTLVNYIRLAFTEVTLSRPSTTSNTVNATIKANYFNATFGAVANTLELKWRYRAKNGTWSTYTTVTVTKNGNAFSYTASLGDTFNFNNEYEFEFIATDKLMTAVSTKTVTRGLPIIDIGKDDVLINGEAKATKMYSDEGELQSKSKNLYNNESGTTNTVTLSESASNFKYLDIFFKDTTTNSNNAYGFVRVYSPNGKKVALTIFAPNLNAVESIRYATKIINISGTTITTSNNHIAGFIERTATGFWDTNEIAIVRVDGYK